MAVDQARQFEIEKTWRQRLLSAPDEQTRYTLYPQAYAEITAFFADSSPEKHDFGYRPDTLLPRIRALCPGRDVVDYGCGYGLAVMDMAALGARSAIGFEVSKDMREWAAGEAARRGLKNIEFRPVEMGRMGLGEASRDLIFCCDVCEHLHPDDYRAHLAEAYRALRPNGFYFCETVVRRFGPNDISREFLKIGDEAQGLHLREYGFADLGQVFREAGFRRIQTPWISPRFVRRSPWRSLSLTLALENSFLGRSGFATGVLGLDSIQLLARK